MTIYIALLRAVNVGGTGKLPMSTLRSMCESLGFAKVRTYLASGNVVFESALSEADVRDALSHRLAQYDPKLTDVLVRSRKELAAVLEANPFKQEAPSQTLAIFLPDAPAANWEAGVSGQGSERIALGTREVYVHYADGIGRSKLKIADAATGSGRNMRTIGALVDLASE
jgi:uncharacterized protein (DUF1697 family)